jgi:hypothetical protein
MSEDELFQKMEPKRENNGQKIIFEKLLVQMKHF